MQHMEQGDTASIVERILARKKYRNIAQETVTRIVRSCLARYPRSAAEVRARSLLHQIWGAYAAHRPNFARCRTAFEYPLQSAHTVEENISALLKTQSSTRERMLALTEFYKKIFALTGVPRAILDHACGMNPMTLPWMGLREGAIYRAYDIDREAVTFLEGVAPLIAPHVRSRIAVGDVFLGPFPYAEVVFMLKLLPVIEQQEKGASIDLLRQAQCKHLVVSFPTQALGGGKRRMGDFYAKWFEKLIAGEHWPYGQIRFPNELVYVVRKL